MRFRIEILGGLLLACAGLSRGAEETPLLAHSPTLSKTQWFLFMADTYGVFRAKAAMQGN